MGATMVKREYERLLEVGERDVTITSCCHTVNLLVEKYYPRLVGYLAPVVSPMLAHCTDIKSRYPNAKAVFIGPCLSKKDEAEGSVVDAALTFDELSSMFTQAGIVPVQQSDRSEESRARLFPTTGGVLKTMEYKNPAYTYLTIDGMDSCKSVLEDIASGNIHRCFIEMSACIGSCIGGPIMRKNHNSPVRHYQAVTNYAGERDFDTTQLSSAVLAKDHVGIEIKKIVPTENEITEILHKMGKFSTSDELNCGTCGYNSCREKAVAVFQGKAEISMCLPYLMEKSEHFSNNILNNTPNGILVVNESLEVQQINPTAMKMLKIRYQSEVLGEQVGRILDAIPFVDLLRNGKQVRDKRDYYAEYDKYLEQTIIHDKTSHVLISILRDVTDEETARRNKEELRRQTADTADRVVDKQMRIVQEIASLLGETAAETKIALTKLKESMYHDDGE